MKVSKSVLLGALFGFLLSVPIIVHAAGPETESPGLKLAKFFLELNVSEPQKTEIAGHIVEHRDSIRETVDALRASHEDVISVVRAEEFDEEALRVQAKQSAALYEELIVLKAQAAADVRSVFDERQKSLIDITANGFRSRIGTKIGTMRSLMDTWVTRYAST